MTFHLDGSRNRAGKFVEGGERQVTKSGVEKIENLGERLSNRSERAGGKKSRGMTEGQSPLLRTSHDVTLTPCRVHGRRRWSALAAFGVDVRGGAAVDQAL